MSENDQETPVSRPDLDHGQARELGSISVVVPVYKSSETLAPLLERILQALKGITFEVIFVDDGSSDSSWATIRQLASKNPDVRGIRLGRNFGQHSALLAGVRAARYPITVTIDDDLQNPPEEIPKLLDALTARDADVVYGVPMDASHAGWRRGSGWLVRKTMRTVLGVDEAVDFSSFRAFRTSLRDAFDVALGPGVSLDALLSWGTTNFTSVQVAHAPRAVGKSNYSLRKLWNFSIDTFTGYSAKPLKFVSLLGFCTAAGGLVLMIFFVLIPYAQGRSLQGFPFLASTIVVFSGIQLITLGVIGEYLARMHFRMMNKPEFVIAERI